MDNNSEDKKNNTSSIIDLLMVFGKKISFPKLLAINTTFGNFLLALIIILTVMGLASVVPTYITEDAKEVIQNIQLSFEDFISTVGDRIGNLFTGKGLTTDQEYAAKMELDYHLKLQEVYDEFKRKYNVSIDTTMITATLTYLKLPSENYQAGIAGEINEEDPTYESDSASENELEDFYEDEATFYKAAKAHIKTLAKYQLVESNTINKCVSASEAQSVKYPETAQDIATKWTSINYGWNTRTSFNYVPYNSSEVIQCPYQDAEQYLRPEHNKDRAAYKQAYDDYNSCKSSVYSNCMSQSNSKCPSTTYAAAYDQCVSSNESSCRAQANSQCSAEETEMNKRRNEYYRKWINEGLFDELDISSNANPRFNCVTTSIWGELNRYNDADQFRNYEVTGDPLKDAQQSTFLNSIKDQYTLLCMSGACANTICSQRPSMSFYYGIDIAREGVYYWKLLANIEDSGSEIQESFIKNYYFPDEDVKESTLIKKVEEIFDAYDTIVEEQEALALGCYSNLCPNGIAVEGVGTLSLEEYVAGVVEAENNVGTEAMKAQAVAARTYALNATQGCTTSIKNSTSAQTYKTPGEAALRAAQETAGEILTYDGEIFSSQYDAFCPQNRTCSGGMCTTTYTKLPNGETHTVTAPESDVSWVDSGHCRGMSQYGARYLEKQGKNYREILAYFYSDGVEISVQGNSDSAGCFSGSENGGDGQVVVENGIFYIPKDTPSGKAGSKGTGEGGLNIYFWQRLQNLFAAAEEQGYKLGITDYWRSYEAQVKCKEQKPTLCATPGKSMHGWGLAADLNYRGNKEAKDWVHKNAASFGLRFSVCKDYFGGVCKEDWHIEPDTIIKR